MADKPHLRASMKRIQIDKSQSTMLIAAAVAGFFLAFMLVGGKAMVDQIKYQNKVIGEKKKAVAQLRANVQASTNLESSYKAFVGTSQNVIGGDPDGSGARDGDNAKIVLDALPSKYDFPALTTSLEKLITDQSLTIDSITGSDDEVAQLEKTSSPTPETIAMPFSLAATGTYSSTQKLISSFNGSIRPFQIQKLEISGSQTTMSVNIEAQTFYQPAKNFNITKKVVK